MGPIRSVLWIGRASDFPAGPLSETPSLDVVWERNPERARALDDAFDAIVLDARDANSALRDLGVLHERPRASAIVVRLDARCAARRAEIEAAGAHVQIRLPDADAHETCALLVAQLDALASRRSGAGACVPRGAARPSATQALVGRSAGMQRVFALVERAAAARATVLVSGETGTGKELVARAIHRGSARRDAPFVAFNCAALPESLLEGELLGHTRGAFTGAERDRKGLVEEAHGGTLLLDEVGEASAALQVKLLRVLQERTVRPLGASRERPVDVRIIAATHRALPREVAALRFRQDLYYRLAVFPIEIPPLRARPEDLPELAEHLLARIARAENRRDARLSAAAHALLATHAWPGNVRELDNELARALVLAEPGATLEPAHFSERLGHSLAPLEALGGDPQPGETLRETLARVEAWLLRRALASHQRNRTETARALGITREGLYKKMKRHGIA